MKSWGVTSVRSNRDWGTCTAGPKTDRVIRVLRTRASAGADTIQILCLRRAGFLNPSTCIRNSIFHKGSKNKKIAALVVVFEDFFVAFFGVSLHGESKNTISIFSGKSHLWQKKMYAPTYLRRRLVRASAGAGWYHKNFGPVCGAQ
jgi:hypothetical protein